MEVKIRNADAGDLEAMKDLLGALFSLEADFAVDAERQHRGLSLMLDGCGKHRCVKVAEVEGRVVGMCTAQTLISTAEGGIVALVEDMVVHERFRGQGIGRWLMESVEAWAREHGANRLQLLADRTNASALEFYHRLGWQSTRLICLRRIWNQFP
jgi:ribosomal protein S18 acetylase RimI-like enzyme